MLALILALFAFAGVVGATGDTLPAAAPAAQTTPGTDAPAGAPAAQQTAPLAVPTGGVPIGIATGEPSTGNNSNTDAQAPQGGTAGSTQGGSTPWLIGIILAVVVVLAVIAFLMMRSRRAAVTEGPAVAPAPRPAPAPAARTTTTTTSTTTPTPAPPVSPAAPVAAAGAAATGAAAAGTPATVTCPNCGTANQLSENFCHECGQDLRPVKQQMMAAAAPPQDVVTDDMPYLETLDRTDEQLEYVLSRPRVVLGTAPGCDVVIGDVFEGHETVSPRHAELRKEGDTFMLVDLGSEHGTFVNDVRTGENLLSDGDEVRLGSVRFVFRVPQG